MTATGFGLRFRAQVRSYIKTSQSFVGAGMTAKGLGFLLCAWRQPGDQRSTTLSDQLFRRTRSPLSLYRWATGR
ncbi:hypothetical protein SAMN05216421_0748 [Halopseudomonas xinjiangensis]|uniref:Uncharacterized protein n=1 Tax=Halopseudomonas xinjiangensis TaxID=487184 RepID=A0A1H1NRX1_9GAMM|nr:hypothetical protein SAMN05216421_0748 [Halopseudomonas xinjiangensis]